MFSNKHHPKEPTLYLRGIPITYTTSTKYLGIFLDRKLTMTPHIQNKIASAKKFMAKASHLARHIWGPKPHLMRWVFLRTVRPMLSYGALVWAHKLSSHKTLRTKIMRFNHFAINAFAPIPKSTPNIGVEIIYNIMPFHLHCIKEALYTFFRIHHLIPLTWSGVRKKSKNSSTSHLKHWETVMTTAKLNLKVDTDYTEFFTPPLLYHVDRNSFQHPFSLVASKTNVYTDGSKKDFKVGAGFVISFTSNPHHEASFHLPDYCTVFQAEIFAIKQAATYLLQTPQSWDYIKIFCDSQEPPLKHYAPPKSHPNSCFPHLPSSIPLHHNPALLLSAGLKLMLALLAMNVPIHLLNRAVSSRILFLKAYSCPTRKFVPKLTQLFSTNGKNFGRSLLWPKIPNSSSPVEINPYPKKFITSFGKVLAVLLNLSLVITTLWHTDIVFTQILMPFAAFVTYQKKPLYISLGTALFFTAIDAWTFFLIPFLIPGHLVHFFISHVFPELTPSLRSTSHCPNLSISHLFRYHHRPPPLTPLSPIFPFFLIQISLLIIHAHHMIRFLIPLLLSP